MTTIWLVTISYPNPAHDRTETFYDENEAHGFFVSLKEDWPKSAKQIFLTFLDGFTAQVILREGGAS